MDEKCLKVPPWLLRSKVYQSGLFNTGRDRGSSGPAPLLSPFDLEMGETQLLLVGGLPAALPLGPAVSETLWVSII